MFKSIFCCRHIRRRAQEEPIFPLDAIESECPATDGNRFKVLLLGIDKAGKSTIVKQLRILHGQPLQKEERKLYIATVHRHVISRVKEFASLNIVSNQFEKELSIITKHQGSWIDEEAKNAIRNLWKKINKSDPHYLDVAYFVTKLDTITNPLYIPSDQDLCFVRLPTYGVRTTTINYNKKNIDFYDVGGQKSERRKWIHYFDNVHTVMFVVAISEYDEVTPDGENRLLESLALFSNMCINPYLMKASFILFFNKMDIFEEKISRIDLKSVAAFRGYPGESGNAELALKYIEYLFLKSNRNPKRQVYGLCTCALDRENIKTVFGVCASRILTNCFDSVGLGD